MKSTLISSIAVLTAVNLLAADPQPCRIGTPTNESAALPTSTDEAKSTAAKSVPAKVDKEIEKQMTGLRLVADRSLSNISKFRTLGMHKGFGNGEPLCDFIATDKWVSVHGDKINSGDVVTIKKATIVEATDGYGNTGTKLILDSAAPREGLVFYCYAFNRGESRYWAIGKAEIEKALNGYFHIEETAVSK